MDQVYIVNELKVNKIMMSTDALNELQRLEDISINRNPRFWMNGQQDVLRICSLNCAGLQAHIEDIKADQRLLKADILLFQETSLTSFDQESFEIHHILFNSM